MKIILNFGISGSKTLAQVALTTLDEPFQQVLHNILYENYRNLQVPHESLASRVKNRDLSLTLEEVMLVLDKIWSGESAMAGSPSSRGWGEGSHPHTPANLGAMPTGSARWSDRPRRLF